MLTQGKYDNGFGSAPINTVDSFIAEVTDVQKTTRSRFYFRGDRDSLIPHIGKVWYYGDRKCDLVETEQNILHRFRRFANPEVDLDNWWATLILARHHELPTRLLDWSTNPLVALYFALNLRASSEKPRKPRAKSKSSKTKDKKINYVWAIELFLESDRADIDVLARDSHPLKPDTISLKRADGSSCYMNPGEAAKIVFPVYNSARITAQRGVFTWQSHPKKALQNYDKNLQPINLDIAKVYRWSVPNEMNLRTKLMENINRLGIDARALSPDFDGVCKGLLNTVFLFGPNSKEM